MSIAIGLPPEPGTIRTPDAAPRTWAPPRVDPPTPSVPSIDDAGGAEGTSGAGFGEMVADAVRSVDARAKDAGRRAQDLAAGRSYDVHGTMIALEESGIATRLLANVRNRAIEAYREIMRMGA